MRFLVVDDEEPVRSLLCELIEDMGHEASAAPGGEEGLDAFDRGGFDAVITDIGMPRMSGWELAEAVRGRSGGVPIVVVTGWGEAVGTAEKERARVDWVITKPFTMGQIEQVVESLELRVSRAGAGGVPVAC